MIVSYPRYVRIALALCDLEARLRELEFHEDEADGYYHGDNEKFIRGFLSASRHHITNVQRTALSHSFLIEFQNESAAIVSPTFEAALASARWLVDHGQGHEAALVRSAAALLFDEDLPLSAHRAISLDDNY